MSLRTQLAENAFQLGENGKGILAADESTGTIGKRFSAIQLENSEQNRKAYRDLLFTAEGFGDYIAGVILFDETFHQASLTEEVSMVDLIQKVSSFPGIKVDCGAKSLANYPNETITEGLDGLPDRMKQYADKGAKFAKWRAVVDINTEANIPSAYAIKSNVAALARYAAICQENGIVPIVEPEVLMDGNHSIDVCYEVTSYSLRLLFNELQEAKVDLEGIILKPNMVISGIKNQKRADVSEVAEKTVRCLKENVPVAVPTIAFLSGGQKDVEATEHLNAINAEYDMPWNVTFSYGRALQAATLQAWGGNNENRQKAQDIFLHRAKMNYLAARGEWSKALEK